MEVRFIIQSNIINNMNSTIDISQVAIGADGKPVITITVAQVQASLDNLQSMLATNIETITEAQTANVAIQSNIDKGRIILAQLNK